MPLTLDLGVLQWECWKYLPLWIPLKTKRSFWETFGYFLSKRVRKFLIAILNMKLLMFMLLYFVLLIRGTLGMFMHFNCFVTEYFGSMRHLLEAKVPQSLDKSPTPPTPQAESIFNMIISPIQFAVLSKDKEFR